MLQDIRSFWTIKEDETDLNRARFRALSRQLPLMYGILSINTLAVALTHMDVAPAFQAIVMPVVVLLFAALRTIRFLEVRHRSLSDAEVLRGLRQTLWLTFPTGVIICVWSLSFYQFGDDLRHAQIVFFIGVTLLTCAFCMMHLKQASILVTVTVSVITCGFLISLQSTVMLAVALNLAIVAVALCSILLNSERDFARMVTQRRIQREQHNRLLALNEENERLANTDSLTTLANRRQFLAEIDKCVEQHEHTGQEFVVALMDLDGFKPINDVFGHPAGDQVLVDTAMRLRKLFRGQPVTIARLGGDEFGLLIRNPCSDENVMALAQKACSAFDTPFKFEEGAANLSATIGMARFPTAANTRSLLFDRADYALYYAKQHAKSEPVFFSHEHERLIFASSALEQALRHADLEKEMRVEFQPVLDLKYGHTKGLEALARWSCPTLGRIRPDLFIKAAENIGMIGRLTEVLFRKAVDEARLWPNGMILSFNLSATSLTCEAPIMRLLSIAERAGFPMERLVFEITESAVMKDFDSAMHVLNVIRSAGAKVAIDDFGTGFSSLAYVHRLPIDILKIDRSFVRDLSRNERSSNVLRSILGLCKNLKIACIVEGVETQEQFDLVSDLGARLIQGYYYSKPLSAGDAHMVLQIEFDTTNRPPLRAIVNQ